jgi:hypothetical protein
MSHHADPFSLFLFPYSPVGAMWERQPFSPSHQVSHVCVYLTVPSAPTIPQVSAIILSPRTNSLRTYVSLFPHRRLVFQFQQIINNALKAYEKCTKQDLLTHPLASELQVCNSPAAILTVLQQQVVGLDQSRSSDDRRTKWLVPTVKVLYTFSATLEERAGLVSLRT